MEKKYDVHISLSESCLDVLNKYNYDSSRLVAILLEIQEKVEGRYISRDLAHHISAKLNLPLSRLYDVISFYSALYDRPRAKIHIQICESVVCRVNQSHVLLTWLERLVGIGLNETSGDGNVSLESVACFGACDRSPALRINGNVYGPITSEQVLINILEEVQCG